MESYRLPCQLNTLITASGLHRKMKKTKKIGLDMDIIGSEEKAQKIPIPFLTTIVLKKILYG
jgi:hypothetical protein